MDGLLKRFGKSVAKIGTSDIDETEFMKYILEKKKKKTTNEKKDEETDATKYMLFDDLSEFSLDTTLFMENDTIHNGGDDEEFTIMENDDDDDDLEKEYYQEEQRQIKRLGSWGTFRSLGSATKLQRVGRSSSSSLSSSASSSRKRSLGLTKKRWNDDDNNNKNSKKNKKRVSFDYPPISSMKRCDYTISQEEISKLFFSEDELDQIQKDRYNALSTDEVEVVLVREKKKLSKQSGQSPAPENNHPKQRLVNRVQIYVRIRSTGIS